MTQAMSGSALDVGRRISTADTNAAVLKAGPGRVYGWSCFNSNAAARYLKLYDTATAPTVGTTVPKLTIALPPGVTASGSHPQGITFSVGISMALTTGVADADTAAVAAAEQTVNIFVR